MRPQEFVSEVVGGVSGPPKGPHTAKAKANDVRLLISSTEELVILSYYYSPKHGCMVIDVGPKE